MSAEPTPEWEPAPPPAPAPAEERSLSLGGFQLFVREQGAGHPLLLINGLGGNVEMWAPAERRLAAGARTIVFDAPGMGRSRTSPVPLPLPVVAKLICHMLDELGHDRVDVIGYSLGGVMAQQLARTAPRRVRRLALVATSCGWGSVPPEAVPLVLISTPLRFFSPSFYRHTSHVLDGSDRFRDPERARAQSEARSAFPPSMIGYAQQFLQGTTWSSLHWVRSLRMPTLVVSGERDRLVPAVNGMLLARQLPNSRLHVLAGEGHLMLFDPESAALGLLEDFFFSADLADSEAWEQGMPVDDDVELSEALRATPGAQPFKAMSSIFRAWVRSPVIQSAAVRRLFRS